MTNDTFFKMRTKPEIILILTISVLKLFKNKNLPKTYTETHKVLTQYNKRMNEKKTTQ